MQNDRDHTAQVVVAAATGALLLRLPALGDGFWLDEIWSLRFSGALTGPLGVFTSIHHDNNHYLNTLWMWLVGPTAHWTLYRLPSLVAGLLTVALAAKVGRRLLGEAGGYVCALFFMVGYPMIHYSTEARGYALAMLCALYAFDLLVSPDRRKAAMLFAAASVVGLLAHLTFFFFLGSRWVWLAIQVLTGKRKLDFYELFCYFAVPGAAVLLLFWFDVRHIQIGIGGGDHETLADVIPSFYGYSFGFPREGIFFWLGAACLAALVYVGWKALRKRGHPMEASLALLCIPFPLIGLIFFSGPVVVERYLLISLPFLYLLVAAAVVELHHGKTRQLANIILIAFCGGSLVSDIRFLREGRGHYLEAVQYLEKNDATPAIEVASDQVWRNGIVADYYSFFLPPGRELRVSNMRTKKNPPAWFLAHRIQDDAPEPEPEFTDPLGQRFVMVERFPKWGLSGFRWFLYKRMAP